MNDNDKDRFVGDVHPFTIRIWLEETAEEAGRAGWRGHITHVPSGRRRYLKDLDDITAFIAPYLGRMGVALGPFWRAKQWLKRWKKCMVERG
jgi:hypothetical protein